MCVCVCVCVWGGGGGGGCLDKNCPLSANEIALHKKLLKTLFLLHSLQFVLIFHSFTLKEFVLHFLARREIYWIK